MHRSDLSDLTAFIAVADNLSFRAAAARLGLTPSALSHSMRQLEERLGVRLLHRTTRSVSITDAGVRLIERLRPAIEQIDGALEGLNTERQKPFGRLKIYAGNTAASTLVAPIWKQFLAANPNVHLEVQVGEAPIDIVARGFDAGIGPQESAHADMVVTRITGPVKTVVVGAPAYFETEGIPSAPQQLVNHRCIQYRRGAGGTEFNWRFERNGESEKYRVGGQLMVNEPSLALRAALEGIGLAYLLDILAEPFVRSGQLIKILEQWMPTFDGFVIYYPGHRQVPSALRAFIDMMRAVHIHQPPRAAVVK